MLATFSFGCRVNTWCTIIEAIVSWMARSSSRIWSSGSFLPNPSNVALPPHSAAIAR